MQALGTSTAGRAGRQLPRRRLLPADLISWPPPAALALRRPRRHAAEDQGRWVSLNDLGRTPGLPGTPGLVETRRCASPMPTASTRSLLLRRPRRRAGRRQNRPCANGWRRCRTTSARAGCTRWRPFRAPPPADAAPQARGIDGASCMRRGAARAPRRHAGGDAGSGAGQRHRRRIAGKGWMQPWSRPSATRASRCCTCAARKVFCAGADLA